MTDTPKIDTELYEYIIALNCSINETYIATVIDALKFEYITNLDIRSYLTIIFNFYNKHQKIPTATEIKAYLDTDELKTSYRNVVTKFKTLDTQYDMDELLSNTEQFIKEKAVYFAVKNTVNEISDKNAITDTAAILDRFQNACNVSLVDSLGFDYFNNIDQHIHDISVADKFIPTGYKWLDKVLGGGWLENGRALYMFLGGTNVGKSLVLGNVATRLVEQGKTVVIISLEMSEMIYGKRIDSQLTRIPFAHLRQDADILKRTLYEKKNALPTSRLIIKEFPPSSITCNNIKAYLKQLRNKWGVKPDAVVLDYLTLLLAVRQTGSLYGDGKAVAEEVRALTYPEFFGCPFISAGQINRSGMSETNPDLDKTGESVGIPATADAIFNLWQTEAEYELGILNVGIKKSRFGVKNGKQAFKIDYDTLAIDEMEDVFSTTDSIQKTDSILDKLSK